MFTFKKNRFLFVTSFVLFSFTVSVFAATNAVSITKLKVPYYKQQLANSCEAASLRMALAYHGVKIQRDMSIILKFGYKPKAKDWDKNIWDDPQKQFVGHANISGKPKGGYGTYGLPVVKAAKAFGRDAEYATGTAITAPWLAEQIEGGYPVVIWGATSLTEPPYTWNTPAGVEVKAFKGEHARTLIGFKGSVENPEGFYIHDPWNGKASEYWTTADLMEHMNLVPGVTDQVVVVK